MIDPAYVQRMARYNRWQNENLYGVADRLSDAERRRERGAFFGSIHQTLSHYLVGRPHLDEQVRRLRRRRPAEFRNPSRSTRIGSLLRRERATTDASIIEWADSLAPAALAGDLTWHSNAVEPGHQQSQSGCW